MNHNHSPLNDNNNIRKQNATEKVEYAEPVWNISLFRLQQKAPKAHAIKVPIKLNSCPEFYGHEYHGSIGNKTASQLLLNDGDYLIRKSPNSEDFYTLSLRMCNKVLHFKLFYNGKHYVHDRKYFDLINDLVMDGIITMYIESKAGSHIQLMHEKSKSTYESPYMTFNRIKLRNQKRAKEHEALSQPDIVINYDKAHCFIPHTFKGFYWCEHCGHFLWGFINQGVKCEDCALIAHFKCSEKLPADCCPDLKQLRGVFGIDLTTLVKAHKTTRPFVVDMCVKEIESRGLDAEGLYRISGYQEDMDNLRMAFEKDGHKADIGIKSFDNINVVASILKLYFRLLPIPLITFEAHPKLLEATQAKSLQQRIQIIKTALSLLPPAHYNTLKYLLEHLHRVTEHSAENKMTSQNLSTVFAPSIMPPPDFDSIGANIPDMCNEINALQLLITNNEMIFQ